MRKYGWKITVLVILAILVLVWLVRAPILSAYLSSKMGVHVSIRWVGLWPSTTKMHVFSLKNPPGFQESALKAEEVICRYSIGKLLSDPAVIDQIEVKHSLLRIDSFGGSSNWAVLEENMQKEHGNSAVLVRKVIFTDFNVEIRSESMLPYSTHFERFEFDDMSSQKGFPTTLIVKRVFETIGVNPSL